MARLAVVGPGRVGTALALAFSQSGHTIVGAYARDVQSSFALRFRRLTGAPVLRLPAPGLTAEKLLPKAEVFLIAVPDRAVTEIAQTLADSGILADPSDGSTRPIVIHTAGSRSANALSPAEIAGARCVCMHPLQTIAYPESSPQCFHNVTFSLDGESSALAEIDPWIRQIGGVPTVIDPDLRSSYHAAAVLASNAVVALIATAVEISGLKDGLHALLPLLEGTVHNLEHTGLPTALTGPVERGDVATIQRHLLALQNNPTALAVYRALGLATLQVAKTKGTFNAMQEDLLHRLFAPDN